MILWRKLLEWGRERRERELDDKFRAAFDEIKGCTADQPDFWDYLEDDEEDELADEVIYVGATEPLPVEWEEKHPKYRSMSQAAHESLCFRKVPAERDNPCGFHIPGVRR